MRVRILAAAGVLATGGAYAAGSVPCAVMTLQPTCQLEVTGGPVFDTADLVHVDRRGPGPAADVGGPDHGRLFATTIEVSEPDGWVDWLASHRDPSTAMIARSLLVPPGQGLEAVAEAGRRSMAESQQRAAGLALFAVGLIDAPDAPVATWPVTITFATDGVGGPSAGLMIALSIAARAGPEDLAAGLRVAGTGVLSPSGAVQGVGGIDHKLRSAIGWADGTPLDAFLLPESDLARARRTRLPADVLLVPVRDLDAAIRALAALRAGRVPDGAELLYAAYEGSR